jgi:LPS-assembly protein
MRLHISVITIFTLIFVLFSTAKAQNTNPVERQVANPITDTPNINPISAQDDISAPKTKKVTSFEQEGGDGEVVVYSDSQTVEGEGGNRIVSHVGNVDVRFGIYRMQADKITIYEGENKIVAEGSVVFDQGDDQRITGSKGVWNYKTKLGTFEESTGFTNQTNDGTVIYFTADRVERTGLEEVRITNGQFTACEDAVPQWSFSAAEAIIRPNDRLKLKSAKFKIRNQTIIPVPFASIPLKEQDRSSGFLTPTFGFSPNKGARLTGAYYQTLGRSADVTLRGDVFTSRGLGFGMDFRTRANSRSYFDFGFYVVKDRLFGAKATPQTPDQGGSLVYAQGVQYFPNGFTGVADVRLTSNLAFRQVFSDGIQQIISPIEVSQAFVNKSWNNYTLNILARSQEISIPNVQIKTRNLPSVNFEKRPSKLSFLDFAYFSFKANLDGISRREAVTDVAAYQSQTGNEPVVTPVLGQRLDVYPQVTVPLNTKYFNFTATAGARVTYYSNSFNDFRQVVGRDVIRKYGEFEFDIRPVALARNFYGKNDAFKFRHVIEPFATYRLIKGVNNFRRIIRYDATDTITDTNELEYGITNRIYTRRYSEAVTEEAQKFLREKVESKDNPLSVQPYEIFSLTVRQKYFFDKTFGDSLVFGRRNQIAPITALSFYTFGGVPRRFSPINIDGTYRPAKTISFNTRMDIGVQGDGLRQISATVGYDTRLFKAFQTFYYTRAVSLIPSLRQFTDPNGKEAGTLRGSQWSPAVFVGNRDKGWYGGTSFFFDFENSRNQKRGSPLISSLYTLGFAGDCCSTTIQYYTYDVGVRRENRFVLSFKLKGIGTFGTEQIGQAGLR